MSIGYVKKTFVKIKETDKEIPATKAFTEEASMEEIFEAVDKMFSEGMLSRDVKQYLWHRYASVHLKEIGDQFKISESAVSHAASRVSKTIAKDKKVRKIIDKLINRLNHSRFTT
jgi:chromosomal replication initiation ATPase DnaA